VRKNDISLPKWSGGAQSHRHGGGFGEHAPPQTNLLNVKYYKSVEFVAFS